MPGSLLAPRGQSCVFFTLETPDPGTERGTTKSLQETLSDEWMKESLIPVSGWGGSGEALTRQFLSQAKPGHIPASLGLCFSSCKMGK